MNYVTIITNDYDLKISVLVVGSFWTVKNKSLIKTIVMKNLKV